MSTHSDKLFGSARRDTQSSALSSLFRMVTTGLPQLVSDAVDPVATRQTPITIVTEILAGKTAELKKYLATIGDDIKGTDEIDFFTYRQLHYCTFIVVPANHPSPAAAACDLLVFEANIDGDARQFIKQLVTNDIGFVDKVYGSCLGYPGGATDGIVDYLLLNNRYTNAFYVSHPGQTREVIERQRSIRQRIQQLIDDPAGPPSGTPQQIHDSIATSLSGTVPVSPRPFLVRHGTRVLFASLAVLAGFVILSGLIFALLALGAIYAALLRRHETSDKQDDTSWQNDGNVLEDRQLQNHLTSVTEIKPGWFRLATLYVVLAAVNVVARLMANKGDLSGIVTIHFARWVILRGNNGSPSRLMFLSNYDGSWENYLGEFIDYASVGLTAIWSNTQLGSGRGFPDTRWLAFKGGSRDARRFKNFARNSQLAESIWFSAYPDLSVKNVDNNRNIHEGLFSDDNIPGWLKTL